MPDYPPYCCMDSDSPIVRPLPRKRPSPLGPLAVLAATRPDLTELCRLLGLGTGLGENFYHSQLYPGPSGCALAGPFIGAPYAVMLLESLVRWGARRVLLLGWCGAVAPGILTGDLILPSGGLIDEGTSRHYGGATASPEVDPALQAVLRQALRDEGRSFHEGTVWTTDAVFRETPRQVKGFRAQGALAVDMELSALLSAGRFLGVAVAGLLVVSDELSDLQWRPGFRDARFQQARREACGIVGRLCQSL
jgi:purine-nucleoside phosphorylase